jgi:micrococcal nuclease
MRNFIFLLLLICLSTLCNAEEIILKEYTNISVIRVIDGDTIEVQIGKKNERVRLMGIQAPELFTEPPQDFSYESKESLEKLLQAKKVTLKYNPKYKKDKYKRILADIYLEDNNLWVNGYLIEKGLAFTYILNRNPIPFVKDLIELENKAISNNLPFWQNQNYKIISADDTEKYVGNYKLVEAEVINIVDTKKTLWIQLSQKTYKGFSLRINKNNFDYVTTNLDLKSLQGKKIRVRGFIDKYSPKYGAFIEVQSPYNIELLN